MIKLEVSLQELKWIYLGLGWYDTEGRRFDDPDREEFERFTDYKGLRKGNISEALEEAIDMWIQAHPIKK
jgi:hypothetical protein